MHAPIFPLTFVGAAFVGKPPEDKSSCADAYSQDKYSRGCQRDPVSHVGTERIVCEPVHKNPPQSISDNEDGNAACVAIPLIVVSLTAECAG
jgi:hypothetical protein